MRSQRAASESLEAFVRIKRFREESLSCNAIWRKSTTQIKHCLLGHYDCDGINKARKINSASMKWHRLHQLWIKRLPVKVKGLVWLPTLLKVTPVSAAPLRPSATFSSLLWFTGPSGWGPAALTGPCVYSKSQRQLPALKLKRVVPYTCALKKCQRAEGKKSFLRFKEQEQSVHE